MKRFFGSLIATILAFTAGLVTASSWASERKAVYFANHVEELCKSRTFVAESLPPPPPPPPVQSYSATPPAEFDFGNNGLRLVPERVKLESNTLGYDIDVSYPQILAIPATETTNIKKVNQQIKESVTKLYQWPMSRQEQVSYSRGQGIRNTVNFTYQVGLATDSFLAIHFMGYSFNSHSTQRQDSFAVNYDLTTGRPLKLSELFKPGSEYMTFISRYSRDALFRQNANPEALEPSSGNFDVWQITTQGIAFNFAACKVANCSEGELVVEIPYSALTSILNADIPGRFNITYP